MQRFKYCFIFFLIIGSVGRERVTFWQNLYILVLLFQLIIKNCMDFGVKNHLLTTPADLLTN